ncbi:MAG TPA: hypothetical protein VF043_21225 [Ktedonobacteraceae bacterium]
MQFQEEDEGKKYLSTERHMQQELSDPWLELLGDKKLATRDLPAGQANDHEESLFLANDPWNDLLQAQGIEVVDLQQVRLHATQASMDNLEVEQALNVMQEKPVNCTSEP